MRCCRSEYLKFNVAPAPSGCSSNILYQYCYELLREGGRLEWRKREGETRTPGTRWKGWLQEGWRQRMRGGETLECSGSIKGHSAKNIPTFTIKFSFAIPMQLSDTKQFMSWRKVRNNLIQVWVTEGWKERNDRDPCLATI